MGPLVNLNAAEKRNISAPSVNELRFLERPAGKHKIKAEQTWVLRPDTIRKTISPALSNILVSAITGLHLY
jgi:hypothetical protein